MSAVSSLAAVQVFEPFGVLIRAKPARIFDPEL